MATDNKRTQILLESGTNEVEFLILVLGKHRYGINVSKVRTIQVFDPSVVAPVPHQRKEMLGLMSFRDTTISVIDLRVSISTEEFTGSSKPLLIVSEFNNRVNGFIVDGVDRIERCSWTNFEPITDAACDGSQAGIVGTVKLKDGLVIILDLESIMATLDPTMSIDFYAKEIGTSTLNRNSVRIAHCDDSVVIRKLVYKVLMDAGFPAPKQFDNGKDLLDYLAGEGKTSTDIVISDIEMPKMDGLTLCRNIKESKDPLSTIPVVLFSSLIDSQMLAKCRSVGADGAFSKPQINYLVDNVETLVNAKRDSAPTR